MDKLDAII
jgi:hypothetical protein